jgi:hypothetical protein
LITIILNGTSFAFAREGPCLYKNEKFFIDASTR